MEADYSGLVIFVMVAIILYKAFGAGCGGGTCSG